MEERKWKERKEVDMKEVEWKEIKWICIFYRYGWIKGKMREKEIEEELFFLICLYEKVKKK